MKICLPFQPRDQVGGTRTFRENLTRSFRQRGLEFTNKLDERYDILFIITGHNLKEVWRAKRRGVPVVQRLDGVYYFSVHGLKYPLLNAKMKIIHNYFADVVIYQSQYSKYCCEKFLGKTEAQHTEIIYNGVDINHFSPVGPAKNLRRHSEEKIFFTASVFRRPDMIFPIIKALDMLWQRRQNFKFLVAGSFTKNLWSRFSRVKRPYLKYLGALSRDELPQYERASDIFLFTSLNPPCPNNILEAMACGLPICGVEMGAMPELVRVGYDGELVKYPYSSFWHYHPINVLSFADNIERILGNQQHYHQNCIKWVAKNFTIEKMINQYYDIFTRASKTISRSSSHS